MNGVHRMELANQPDDSQSFEEMVSPFLGLVHRVATRMTGSPDAAQDLVQETLLRAYRAHGSLRPNSHIKPWLLRILHNTFVSDWRRRKREKIVLQRGVFEDRAPWLVPGTVGDGPGERPDDGLGDEVVRALAELPDAYRACVLLVDLEQKSYKEAAQLLGRPVGTVMSRLFRGRRLLQGMLGEYARDEGYLRAA